MPIGEAGFRYWLFCPLAGTGGRSLSTERQAVDEFDLVVIGGGNGGYTAAIRATQLGLSAAIIERDKVGGTCLHRGCIPTKVWLETAELLTRAKASHASGVHIPEATLEFGAMLERQRQVVDTLHRSLRSVVEKHKIEIVEGDARVLSASAVAIGDRVLTGRALVLATGSQPKQIPGLETDGQRILTSDDLLQLRRPPSSIVIVGAGAIGCEFASFFLDIGATVTLLEMLPTIVPLEDSDIGKALAKSFVQRGANIFTNARVLPDRTRVYDNRVEITVDQEGQERQVTGEVALIAVGRQANVGGLGLERTGVRIERGFVEVRDGYATAEPGVYAVGDCIGGLLLAHVAAAEGFLAAEAIAGRRQQPLDYNRVPRVTYCRPQVASVGLTEQQAREAGHSVKTQRFSFKYNAMALIRGQTEGFVKIVYDADSGDLLGVHIIGEGASELISEAALARFLEASAWELGSTIHPHPSLSETLGEAAQLSAGTSIYW